MANMSLLSPNNIAAFKRLEELFGGPLNVTSGYRTPEQNASVDGAKKSQHMDANAVDISTSGMSQQEVQNLTDLAKQSGYRGIGVYDNSVHFDVGLPRVWGSSQKYDSAPDWLKQSYDAGGYAPMGIGNENMSMNPDVPPRAGLLGFYDRMRKPDEQTGLNPMQRFGAALDPLILPSMRMGEQVRASGQQRVADLTKNRTMAELQRLAQSGDKKAEMLYAAVKSGALTPPEAYKQYVSDKMSSGNDPTRSTQRYLNGTVYAVTDKGIKVYNPQGNLVTGAEAEKVLQEANDYENKNRAVGLGLSEQAKLQQQYANDAFSTVDKLSASLGNIDTAIKAIDDGAPRNMFTNLLPDVTAESGQLTSALRRMGLDVISSVTFGALSQAELEVAMSTAYPANASTPELRQFLVDRKAAVQKLLAYTEEAATFLSNPSNTRADWMQIAKERRDANVAGEGGNPYMNMTEAQLNEVYAGYNNLNNAQQAQFLEALRAKQGG